MLGVWSEAIHIPKRAVNVLNRCGIMVSYDTTRKTLTSIAKHDREMVMAKIETGRPFGLFWDNLVHMDHKEEETILNKRSLMQHTSAYIHFLNLPEPCPDAPETTKAAYRNILQAVEDKSGVCLPRTLLFKQEAFARPIDKAAFIADDALGMHLREIARLRVGQVLEKMLGRKALAAFKVDRKSLELPRLPTTDEYACLPADRTDMHCLPTMNLDETTIDGTAMVMEDIMEYCGVQPDELLTRSVFATGDQLSNARVRAVKDLRIRDNVEDRHEWAVPKPGLLHVSMAYVQGFLKCHMAGTSGKDPTSLTRFAAMLARTRLTPDGKLIDFNAANRFVTAAWEAHVIAAAETQANVKSIKQLEEWVQSHNWRELIEKVVNVYFPSGKVALQRDEARQKALEEYLELRKKIMEIPVHDRTGRQLGFLGAKAREAFVKKNQIKFRDLAYENTLLLMRDGLLHVDLYRSMREGSCGSYEKDLEIATVFFNGCPGKGTYAKETLRQQMDMKLRGTPEHAYLARFNRVVNLGGGQEACLAVDENGEFNNRFISDDYNARDSWQSLRWHMNIVSVNIMTFRAIRESIENTTGASSGGIAHSKVDDRLDVAKMAKALMQAEVFKRKEGRHKGGNAANPVMIKEVTDCIAVGREKIWTGNACDNILEEWDSQSTWPQLPELAKDDWATYLQGAVDDFNAGMQGLTSLVE
jgi:roadblock/LC7 domain-containing protein